MKLKFMLMLFVMTAAIQGLSAAGGYRGFGRGFRGSEDHFNVGTTDYQKLLTDYPALAEVIGGLESQNITINHVEIGTTSAGSELIKVEALEANRPYDYLIDPATGEVIGRYAD